MHSLLTSASDAGVWLVSCPGYSNSKETATVSIEWDDIRDLENVERTTIFSFQKTGTQFLGCPVYSGSRLLPVSIHMFIQDKNFIVQLIHTNYKILRLLK